MPLPITVTITNCQLSLSTPQAILAQQHSEHDQ